MFVPFDSQTLRPASSLYNASMPRRTGKQSATRVRWEEPLPFCHVLVLKE